MWVAEFFICSLSPGLGDDDDGDANCLRIETVFFGTVLGVVLVVVVVFDVDNPPPELLGDGDESIPMGDDSRALLPL